jgi:hypothetical protein
MSYRDQHRFPGGASLRQRVVRECGPGNKFAALGYLFGEWVRHEHAPSATVEGVAPYLAAYLAQAERIGRRRGTLVGLTLGLAVLAIVIMTIVVFR